MQCRFDDGVGWRVNEETTRGRNRIYIIEKIDGKIMMMFLLAAFRSVEYS